ncbi:MAG: FAD-dependent oxidoreductase [Deltaproteobacteria bacterium]|nr:FAD-dependent oxidoreductase [Deltaproteobacteria bacterium]MBW1947095.1 FAD-dependent oxidoreductase [Deltaproteobacteria bacterium]MBW1967243.1 FAD-dependent oxidoreductase [Deltaproteobacteria bacterium]MBW2098620.1 FAD-dependent oxidoreductase [Deltaproteobacteria bacterium]
MGKRIVVIGGVACGPKSAARAKRLDPGCEIILLEKGGEISYGACGLPFYLEGEVKEIKELINTPVGVPRDVNFFRAVKGVEARVNTEAVEIDRNRKVVKIRDLVGGKEEDLPYDNLVIATGSRPVRPPLPGIDLDGIHCLKTLGDGQAIKKAIEGSKRKKAVIVGAGLIGLECVESLLKAGFETHVIEKLPFVLPALLDEEMAVPLMKHLQTKGVFLHCNDGVARFEDDGQGKVSRVVTEKNAIEADLVILAIGFRPNIELAQKAGLEIGKYGIKVDSHLRTSDPSIYAGGDCIESRNIVTGMPCYAPMGSTANKHGRIIGNNLSGWNSTFSGVCGTGVCRILGFNVARTGLTERDAVNLGYDVLTTLSPGPDRPHYMKGCGLIHLKLIAEAYSGRLLGVQILGHGEVLSRVDTIAALLAKAGTIDDLSEIDMAYAPPFSPAMDNVIVAANIIQNKRDSVARAYSPAEVKAKLDAGEDFILLDVRTPKELEVLSLPYDNVVHIPLGKVRERAGELPMDKEIVCLCKLSLRGYEAARMLIGQGFEEDNIKFLDGGIVAWPYEKIVGS